MGQDFLNKSSRFDLCYCFINKALFGLFVLRLVGGFLMEVLFFEFRGGGLVGCFFWFSFGFVYTYELENLPIIIV